MNSPNDGRGTNKPRPAGNEDANPAAHDSSPGPHTSTSPWGSCDSLWTAVVITSEHLSECSLAQAVTHLIQHMDRYRLNIWTLT